MTERTETGTNRSRDRQRHGTMIGTGTGTKTGWETETRILSLFVGLEPSRSDFRPLQGYGCMQRKKGVTVVLGEMDVARVEPANPP